MTSGFSNGFLMALQSPIARNSCMLHSKNAKPLKRSRSARCLWIVNRSEDAMTNGCQIGKLQRAEAPLRGWGPMGQFRMKNEKLRRTGIKPNEFGFPIGV
jgi:hypothetical protein